MDAADLHLLLKPHNYESHDFYGGSKAIINPTACTNCGQCAEACHFDAIHRGVSGQETHRVDEMTCEGCTLCHYICPVDAITMHKEKTGSWYDAKTDYGPMIHARLGIAQENSGKLVTQVRQRAAESARELQYERIIADGPPGTSCPVIASITGVDLVLIVTEPTVSGVHDLKRVLDLCQHFGVPAAVVINKADLNGEQAGRIHRMAEQSGAHIVGEIPFDRHVHDALMAGKTVLEHGKSPAAEAIRHVWQQLQDMM